MIVCRQAFARLAALTLVLAPLPAAPATDAQNRLRVEGTEFVLELADGRTLRSADLVGSRIRYADAEDTVSVMIESVELEQAPDGRALHLHGFSVESEDGRRSPLCSPDPSGDTRGFPAPDGAGGYSLLCLSGAQGKCAFWGYRAWEEAPGGAPMRALHEACTHMVRADYGGDGTSATRTGNPIAFCDRFDVWPCKEQPYAFEAAWRAEGAACVARTRVPGLASLEDLSNNYPHLRERLGPERCSAASSLGSEGNLLLGFSPE